MTPKNIIETLLIGLVILIAAILTYVGGAVFEHLGQSTAWGRFEALPLLDISLVMGRDYPHDSIRAAVYIGGFLIYFFLGLLLLSLVRDAIKKTHGKKGSGSITSTRGSSGIII